MTKMLFLFVALLGLSGCQSEVDKCVAAGLKANEPFKSEQDKANDEIGFRIACLKAASGKQ
jgi:hypothetical protein